MSPLPPPPPSARPPTPQPRRKTSLRTVPKQVQQQFIERLVQLRADPTRVLPTVEGPEPKAIARIRQGLERIAAGKAGFLIRRDKGILGAVAASIRMADKPAPSRMLDIKVGGQRRFFTVRGQVERSCMLGVQNHDHAPSLLMAYRPMAKAEALHFFATPGLTCTGAAPAPPQAWIDALAERAEIELQAKGGGWTCGHSGGRVILGFRGGPDIEVCGPCGKKAGNLHRLVAARYAGPRQRQPVEVTVCAPDGQVLEAPREAVAEYRGSALDEMNLLRAALAGWSASGRVWMHGGEIYEDIGAWLDALNAQPWERDALAAMASDGYKGEATAVAGILDGLKQRLPAGIKAILGQEDPAFLAAHQAQAVRDLLRAAAEEARRREATARLPMPRTGPIGTFLDRVARAQAAEGKHAALQAVRQSGDVAGMHVAAILAALGGDVGLESRLDPGDREAGQSLTNLARPILETEGEAYLQALEAYLQESGSGEHARRH